MKVLKVSPALLEGFAAKLRSSSGELDTILQGLRSKLDAMEWAGGDREAYNIQRAQWDNASNGLNQLLHDIGTTVDRAKQDYTMTEGTNAQMFV